MSHADSQSSRAAGKRLRIYLMRHGEAELSAEGKLYGHTDASLSREGIEQSRSLSSELAGIPLLAVYSSDLSRALFAAHLIADAHSLTPRVLPDLREANMGEWEGAPIRKVALADPERVSCLFTDPSTFRYPGGESFLEFQARVQRVLKEVFEAHGEGEIAIVTHGGVCRLVIGQVLLLSPRNLLRLSQDFGCLNIIDVYDGQPLLRMMNYLPGYGLSGAIKTDGRASSDSPHSY